MLKKHYFTVETAKVKNVKRYFKIANEIFKKLHIAKNGKYDFLTLCKVFIKTL